LVLKFFNKDFFPLVRHFSVSAPLFFSCSPETKSSMLPYSSSYRFSSLPCRPPRSADNLSFPPFVSFFSFLTFLPYRREPCHHLLPHLTHCDGPVLLPCSTHSAGTTPIGFPFDPLRRHFFVPRFITLFNQCLFFLLARFLYGSLHCFFTPGRLLFCPSPSFLP